MWNHDQSRHAEEQGAKGPEPEAPSPGDLFRKSSTDEAAKDVARRSAKAEKSKGNVLLNREWWESSRQERKRVGYQGAVADAGHCASKVEENNVVREATDEGPNGHPDPPKDEDVLVAKVVAKPSSHHDKGTAAQRVRGQEPRHLPIARRVERTADLLHGECSVAEPSDREELGQSHEKDEDGFLKRR